MSSARFGKKWADVEEDDCPLPTNKPGTTRFESGADADGINTVIEYIARDGMSYKVTKRIKAKVVIKRVNASVKQRMEWKPFNVSGQTDNNARSDEGVHIELSQQQKHKNVGDDEKFWDESIAISEKILLTSKKEKKYDAQAIRQGKLEDERVAGQDQAKPNGTTPGTDTLASLGGNPTGSGATRYVPPSMRDKSRAEMTMANKEETTLRITNLSEDVRDGDLQQLFAPFGRLQRVFLARYRDGEKEGQSKGFAFVTYHERQHAEQALSKLHGYGYDNLILQVNWAKPKQ